MRLDDPDPKSALARERTRLAQERTYAAWVRTGLATLGTGLAVAKLLPGAHDSLLLKILGAALIALSGVMFAIGMWSTGKLGRELATHGFPQAPRLLSVGALVLVACSCLALTYVLMH